MTKKDGAKLKMWEGASYSQVWDLLRATTQARIGLSSSGHAVNTKEHLNFQWAHAQARDAIHTPWDLESLKKSLHDIYIESTALKTPILNRTEYLLRPDLGKRLDDMSQKILKNHVSHPDILIMVSNGLSSQAMHAHAFSFLKLLLEELKRRSFNFGNIFLIENARVALTDPIADILKPKISLCLIGERPGLSSPDSMSLYLTYKPKTGRTDADRNCISNIRGNSGLSYELAIKKTIFLIEESIKRKLSGVLLKDESEEIRFFSLGSKF